ncbi:MAG TPA: type II secretion system protein, partial [Kiritimatiellia bacterium]|nr:type II secretion system protein [Kiritimatiellia bacterium]
MRKPAETLRASRLPSLGFTLVEMLVVVGMLGVLMAVSFSGVGQARKQAKIAKANSETRELINAWLA